MIDIFINKLNTLGINYSVNEPLSLHTSFKIGGPAKVFVRPQNIERVIKLAQLIKETTVRYIFIGRGSNLLFSDNGFDGAVISTECLSEITVSETNLIFGAGVPFTQAALVARDASLTGLEFAYGIPGSVGGAVCMNAGAYGGEVSQVLIESTYLDINSLSVVNINSDEHSFGYRHSIYKADKSKVLLSAKFQLKFADKENIKNTMDDFMNRRKDKQPLEYPSAGSVFKRPNGRFVGQMIEELGLKGYTIGGAQISNNHWNA